MVLSRTVEQGFQAVGWSVGRELVERSTEYVLQGTCTRSCEARYELSNYQGTDGQVGSGVSTK